MALPVKDQLRYWGIATVVFVVILWALGDVLLPFVIGGAIAYFLDPSPIGWKSWGCRGWLPPGSSPWSASLDLCLRF